MCGIAGFLDHERRSDAQELERLATAMRRMVLVPKALVPHLTGRRGRGICQMEDSLGLLIDIMDGIEGDTAVTLISPENKLKWEL